MQVGRRQSTVHLFTYYRPPGTPARYMLARLPDICVRQRQDDPRCAGIGGRTPGCRRLLGASGQPGAACAPLGKQMPALAVPVQHRRGAAARRCTMPPVPLEVLESFILSRLFILPWPCTAPPSPPTTTTKPPPTTTTCALSHPHRPLTPLPPRFPPRLPRRILPPRPLPAALRACKCCQRMEGV